MDFVKALVPGSLLTFVISMILGSNHSKGAWLNIFHGAGLDPACDYAEVTVTM
jgi:hypothetical protein